MHQPPTLTSPPQLHLQHSMDFPQTVCLTIRPNCLVSGLNLCTLNAAGTQFSAIANLNLAER